MNYKLSIFFLLLIFTSCKSRREKCEGYLEYGREWQGSIRIDTVYDVWGDDAGTAQDKIGNKLLFRREDMTIQPIKGDSLYKKSGSDIYVLIKDNGTYYQYLDCDSRQKIIKVGDSLK